MVVQRLKDIFFLFLSDSGQHPPSHIFVEIGNLDHYKYIVERIGEINQEYNGNTALMVAVEKEQFIISDYIIQVTFSQKREKNQSQNFHPSF